MKTILFLILILCFSTGARAESAAEIEQRIQGRITQILNRVLPEQSFLVQVVPQGEDRQMREVVEGESVTSSSARKTNLPALPGFVQPPEATGPSGTNRQVYRMRSVFELNSVKVHLLVDNGLSDADIKKAVEILNEYLKIDLGAKFTLSTSRAKLLGPVKESFWKDWSFSPAWIVAILSLLAAAIFFLRSRKRRAVDPQKQNFPEVYPELLNREQPERPQLEEKKPLALPASEQNLLPLGREANKIDSNNPQSFPPLPATEEFADRRVELLDSFLLNAEVFSNYFKKLGDGSQLELYAGLRGPAFDSLLESLGLTIPKDGVPAMAPNEDQIAFYNKDFKEFLKSFEWQEKQFFGFLHQLDDSQIVKLAEQQNPLVTAVILNFLGPDRSAKVLDRLPSARRIESLAQLEHCRSLPAEELKEMENHVRLLANALPRMGAFQKNLDLKFWSRLLSQVENQEQILLDLEQVYPALYPKLARYRFKLEDMPGLPKPLIQRTLDQVENEELSAALVGATPDLVDFVLNELSQERRELVENQLLMNQGLPPAVYEEHRNSLTKRFREVMA